MKNSAARSELDSMIVEIELTLVSIIQGVALTVLIESARDVFTTNELILWPYVLAGLVTIFVFWSRAILHIITVIRWPLEFGHNFLYIACALVEALLFAQVTRPQNWFWYGAAFIAIGWGLFAYDLRLVTARKRDSAGPANDRLLALVHRDQWHNIAIFLPAVFLLNLACALAIKRWPHLYVDLSGHLWLIAVQLIGFGGYLFYVVKFYGKIAPLIAEARAEWRDLPPSNG
jgi:hypothetical protein